MSNDEVEYRVIPVTRYIVTVFQRADGKACVGECGEFNNEHLAAEVAHALGKAHHESLGWPRDDERITYPSLPLPPTDDPARSPSSVTGCIS